MTPSNYSGIVTPTDLAALQAAFREQQPHGRQVESHLRGVLETVLDHPGSMVRAQLTFAVMNRHGIPRHQALAAAIAVEYFHTASLVLDDLPCMDDATERRGTPCPHVAHGEAAAILGSLALVNRAYRMLWDVLAVQPLVVSRAAAELMEQCLGVAGILDGQARDLHFAASTGDGEEAETIARGKTGALIRLALLLPAVIVRVPLSQRLLLDELSAVWGEAYQAVDDLKDVLANDRQTGKTTARDAARNRPNLALARGVHGALKHLCDLAGRSDDLIGALEAADEQWSWLRRLDARLRRDLDALRRPDRPAVMLGVELPPARRVASQSPTVEMPWPLELPFRPRAINSQ